MHVYYSYHRSIPLKIIDTSMIDRCPVFATDTHRVGTTDAFEREGNTSIIDMTKIE